MAAVQTREKADPTPFNAAVGVRLSLIREVYGHTQVEFAKWIDINQGRLNYYENGRRALPPEIALKIKNRTEIPADWIYFGDEGALPHAMRLELYKVAKGRGIKMSPPPKIKAPLPREKMLVERLSKITWLAVRLLGDLAPHESQRLGLPVRDTTQDKN